MHVGLNDLPLADSLFLALVSLHTLVHAQNDLHNHTRKKKTVAQSSHTLMTMVNAFMLNPARVMFRRGTTHINDAIDEVLATLVVECVVFELLGDELSVDDVLNLLRLGVSLRKALRAP